MVENVKTLLWLSRTVVGQYCHRFSSLFNRPPTHPTPKIFQGLKSNILITQICSDCSQQLHTQEDPWKGSGRLLQDHPPGQEVDTEDRHIFTRFRLWTVGIIINLISAFYSFAYIRIHLMYK